MWLVGLSRTQSNATHLFPTPPRAEQDRQRRVLRSEEEHERELRDGEEACARGLISQSYDVKFKNEDVGSGLTRSVGVIHEFRLHGREEDEDEVVDDDQEYYSSTNEKNIA